MNDGKKAVVLFLLLAVIVRYIPAQTTQADSAAATLTEEDKTPQWVKDLRRWEIVAFGSIPFTMFTATFAMDMYRWNDANGLDFSDEGRQYAPWPLKSAGAALMENREQELVFIMAASMSVAIAFADLIIVQVKRYKERKKAEAIPVGTTIITRTPWPEEPSEEQDAASVDDGVDAGDDLSAPEEP